MSPKRANALCLWVKQKRWSGAGTLSTLLAWMVRREGCHIGQPKKWVCKTLRREWCAVLPLPACSTPSSKHLAVPCRRGIWSPCGARGAGCLWLVNWVLPRHCSRWGCQAAFGAFSLGFFSSSRPRGEQASPPEHGTGGKAEGLAALPAARRRSSRRLAAGGAVATGRERAAWRRPGRWGAGAGAGVSLLLLLLGGSGSGRRHRGGGRGESLGLRRAGAGFRGGIPGLWGRGVPGEHNVCVAKCSYLWQAFMGWMWSLVSLSWK